MTNDGVAFMTVQLSDKGFRECKHHDRGRMCVSEVYIFSEGDKWGFDLNGRTNPHEDTTIVVQGPSDYLTVDAAWESAKRMLAALPPWGGYALPKDVTVDALELKSLLTKLCCYCAPELHAEAMKFLSKSRIP